MMNEIFDLVLAALLLSLKLPEVEDSKHPNPAK